MGRVENKVVEVVCSACKKPFLRSHFNPYMDKCPACRKAQSKLNLGRSEKAKSRVDLGPAPEKRVASAAFAPATSKRGKCCLQMLQTTEKTGMHICPVCEKQWFVFMKGWAKKWGTDHVYFMGKHVGNVSEYGELRRLVNAVQAAAAATA